MSKPLLASLRVVATTGSVFTLLITTMTAQEPSGRGGCPLEPAEFHRCALEKIKIYTPSRMPWGDPDMQGFWNRTVTSNDIEGHPVTFDSPRAEATLIVDPADGKLPYQPWAAAQKKENFKKHIDPQAHCLPYGVPRQLYGGGAGVYQIVQLPGSVVILNEYAHIYRIIHVDGRRHIGENTKLWMGDSRGHWEKNTLVVDVTNQNDRTWFDVAGNFHSDAIHVAERFTLVDADTIHYEATVNDPKVYTRSWKMAFAITRDPQPNFELLEQACYEGERDTHHMRSIGLTPYRGLEVIKK